MKKRNFMQELLDFFTAQGFRVERSFAPVKHPDGKPLPGEDRWEKK